MNTSTIILIVGAGALYLYLRGRRQDESGYTGPPAVITNESSNLAERVAGDVLISFAKRTVSSRNLPRPNSPTGSSAADRMAGR